MRRAALAIGPIALALGIFAAAAIAGGSSIKIVKATNDSGIPGPGKQSVECPGHNQVLGGGFAVANNGGLVQKSKPTGLFGWKMAGLIIGGTGSYDAYALCNTEADRKLKRVAAKVTLPAGGGPGGAASEGGVDATCPSGWQVVSGGYQVKPRYTGGNAGELAVDTNMRKSARTWTVHGGNDGAPTTLTAYAICEKAGRTQISQAQASAEVTESGQTASPTAKCAKDAHLVGGGFQVQPDEAGGAFPVVSTAAPKDARHWQLHSQPEPSGPSAGSVTVTAFAECEQG